MSTDIATIYILVTRVAAVNFAALKQFVAVSSLKRLSLPPSFFFTLRAVDINILTQSSLLIYNKQYFLLLCGNILISQHSNQGLKYKFEKCYACFAFTI